MSETLERSSGAFNCIWRQRRACADSQSRRGRVGVLLEVTLRCSDIIEHTTFIHELRRLTVVLSPEEVARHLGCSARAQMQGGAERGLLRRLARRQYLRTFTRTDVPRVPR